MSDSEEEEIKVTRFKHEGIDYLKSADDFLYDPKTSEVVGYWNAGTKQIEEVVEYDSGSDESDESIGFGGLSQDQGSDESDEDDGFVRPIYGIHPNPNLASYSKEEIEELFSGDNVSYIDKL